MTPAERTELDRLLSSLCDAQLTDAEQARLEQLLADPDARRRYLRYVDLHSYLQTKPSAPAPARAPEAARTGRRSRGWLRYGAAAVAAACATVLFQSLALRPDAVVRDDSPTGPGALPEAYVATLVRADGCEWDSPGPLVAGRRVGPGELRLKKGLARLVFDSNATLILEGGTVLRVESASAATLLAGKAVFRGDDNPETFDLRTPRALLQDLGTEYAVAVGPEGEEVHVFSGEVRRLTPVVGGGVRLNAGQARRFTSDPADTGSPAALAPTSFVRELPPPSAGAAAEGALAYDGFDYPADVGPGAETEGHANGGFGWAGAWRKTLSRLGQERTPPHPVFNPKAGLSRPGTTAPAVGGSFDFPGFAKAHRRLQTPVRMDADGVYYLSFLFRREGPQADDLNALSVAFRTTDELDAEAHDQPDPRMRMNFGVYRANEAFTHLNRVGVHLPLPLSYGQTYLFAAKVVTGRAMPDQAFVRVYAPDEAVGWEEPTAWSLVGPQVYSDLVFDWLQVHVNSRTRQTVDELRLGTTWAAIVHPWVAANRTGGD